MFGYERVSTNGHDLTSQERELDRAACPKTYREKMSGVRADRPELAKLIRRVEPGDTDADAEGLLIFTRRPGDRRRKWHVIRGGRLRPYKAN
jgi:hypothetical protein